MCLGAFPDLLDPILSSEYDELGVKALCVNVKQCQWDWMLQRAGDFDIPVACLHIAHKEVRVIVHVQYKEVLKMLE